MRGSKLRRDTKKMRSAGLVVVVMRARSITTTPKPSTRSTAQAGASELGDYVAYYPRRRLMRTATIAEALSTLADFSKNFPDSL